MHIINLNLVENFDKSSRHLNCFLVSYIVTLWKSISGIDMQMQQKNLNKMPFPICDVLTPTQYCVLSSLPWPCKHHSPLILSRLFYQACLAEGKFFVCDQISPIPDGKLLLNYIRNVSFTSRFRGNTNDKSKLGSDCPSYYGHGQARGL